MAIHKLTGKAHSGARWHRVRRCLSKCKNAKTVVLPFRSNGNYAVQGSSRQSNNGQFGGQSIYLSAWQICDPCCFSIVQSQLSTEPSTAFHIRWWSFLEAEASLYYDNYGVNSQTIQLITYPSVEVGHQAPWHYPFSDINVLKRPLLLRIW